MRRKKEKDENKEINYKIVNNYDEDIKIIKKLIKDVNILEYKFYDIPINYDNFINELNKLGVEFNMFNINELVDSNIDHQFLIVKLLDNDNVINLLVDLEFISFYPNYDISNMNKQWIGDNLLEMPDGIEIINKIIVDGFIPIDNKMLATYLKSFSLNREIDLDIDRILNNRKKLKLKIQKK